VGSRRASPRGGARQETGDAARRLTAGRLAGSCEHRQSARVPRQVESSRIPSLVERSAPAVTCREQAPRIQA